MRFFLHFSPAPPALKEPLLVYSGLSSRAARGVDKQTDFSYAQDVERLDLSRFHVISVIGAGGKTTLCRALTRGLPGKNVYTTTTHMLRPKDFFCLDEPEPAEIFAAFSLHQKIALCGAAADGNAEKVGAPDEAAFTAACMAADHVIVEADGARGRLIKVHGESEPVIPNNSDLVLCAASCTALGQPLISAVHRAERIESFFHKNPDALATEEDIVLALAAPKTALAPYAAVLNRVEDFAAAERIKAILFERYGIPCALIGVFGGCGGGDLDGRLLERVFSGLTDGL